MMVSLHLSNLLLAFTAAMLPLAWVSAEVVNLMLAVASFVIACAIGVQARQDHAQPRRSRPDS
jgi:hypothetical protein